LQSPTSQSFGETNKLPDKRFSELCKSSPRHVEHLQAVAGPVGIVLRDVVESGNLPPAVGIAVDPLGYDAELPVGWFNGIAITALALPLHRGIEPGGIIDMGEQLLVVPERWGWYISVKHESKQGVLKLCWFNT